ncbi:MAG TPA: hypothetical protein VIV60_00415, partial [Polyangiaceae bacterium]
MRARIAFFGLLLTATGLGGARGSAEPSPLNAKVERWFQLDQPFSASLRLRFDARPLPTYETLRLPTFEGSATLLGSGLQLSLFERVAPASELDCRLTCQVVLERSLGLDARLSLGSLAANVPQTYLFMRNDAVRHSR